ncbi:TetR/AcrR family transcriptional regulator [Kribbella sp. NPDC056951]|uniref:TetR/AcrR family transcriptional regulator n=1 Tax=Kribbella sp. NPDC056951 TaxID=3345978 RepID=UPI0036440CBF
MPRNAEPARRRLQETALALFTQHGYEAVTAAEIAAAAGVTERTFFRHFPDKREVLFGGEQELAPALCQAIAEATGTKPLKILTAAFRALEPHLLRNRPFALPRAHVIEANPALRERELTKRAALQTAATEALITRGTPPRQAALAAQVGMALFTQAIQDWMQDPAADFNHQLTKAQSDLKTL